MLQREDRGWGCGWQGVHEATYPGTGMGRMWLGIERLLVCTLATRRQDIVGTQLPSLRGKMGEKGSCLPRMTLSAGKRVQVMGSNVGSCTLVDHPLLVG